MRNETRPDAHRIALFGYYRSAVEVAAYLKGPEYEIVIIDDNENNLAKARDQGYETAKLDYRDDAELKKLGMHDAADTVFSLFPDDAENVFLTISIRALAPHVRIITIAHDPDAVPKLRAAGADKVIDIHEIAGRRIWNLLKRPLVTDLLENTLFGETPLNLAEVPVPEGSQLDGLPLHELNLAYEYDLVLIGVVDRTMTEQFIVTTEGRTHRLTGGDTLLVIGPTDAIECLRATLAG
ncbi:MAG: NAD-binding protein [Pseudomonadota bacterium]|nr:NAD-binding protein [Pseudomonadota bacterium]